MRGGQGGAPAYRHNGGRSTQAGLQDTLEATRLRAAGVGSGLRSHPQRDDFIRRALDVVFRGRAWHFFVQHRPAWQIEDGSKVLQRLRVTASVAERFSWVSGALQEHLSQCARRNLRASVTDEFYVQSAMQPRAGYDLSRASSAIAQASQLRTAAMLPATVDARLRTKKFACRTMAIIIIDGSHFGRWVARCSLVRVVGSVGGLLGRSGVGSCILPHWFR